MRDRLIELLMTEVECNKDGHGECEMCEYGYADKACERHISEILADFLLANGVVVLPFPIGTTYYRIVTKRGKVGNPYFKLIRKAELNWYNVESVLSDFGKTVFLTKEEAERALKGGE